MNESNASFDLKSWAEAQEIPLHVEKIEPAYNKPGWYRARVWVPVPEIDEDFVEEEPIIELIDALPFDDAFIMTSYITPNLMFEGSQYVVEAEIYFGNNPPTEAERLRNAIREALAIMDTYDATSTLEADVYNILQQALEQTADD